MVEEIRSRRARRFACRTRHRNVRAHDGCLRHYRLLAGALHLSFCFLRGAARSSLRNRARRGLACYMRFRDFLSLPASAANIKACVQSLATPGITAASITVTPTWPQQTVNGTTTGCNSSATQATEGLCGEGSGQLFVPLLPALSAHGRNTNDGDVRKSDRFIKSVAGARPANMRPPSWTIYFCAYSHPNPNLTTHTLLRIQTNPSIHANQTHHHHHLEQHKPYLHLDQLNSSSSTITTLIIHTTPPPSDRPQNFLCSAATQLRYTTTGHVYTCSLSIFRKHISITAQSQ